MRGSRRRISLIWSLVCALACVAPLAGVERIVIPADGSASPPADGMFWDVATAIPPHQWPEQPRELRLLVEELLGSMSPEERVAQLLMVSWADSAPTPEIMRWITERSLGGIKVFGWNGENLPVLAEAITTMQRASLATELSIPLFTATDQEGGWVRHVKGATSVTPGNMAIGATGLPYDALMTARAIGLELRSLGINMNFAPTIDVYVNMEAHVIGPRAFSSDPVATGILGVAFYRGLEQAGVIATAKHFPGHGNAVGDSHGILPVIMDDYETVWERDITPFRMLIDEGVPAVLSGHLAFPTITGNNAPASISDYFKQRVLRDELGFEGVVITDDLYMGGALEYGQLMGWSFGDLVREAILAGNDIVMLSRTPEFDGEIWRTLMTAWENDPTFRNRIDESVRRILRVKLAYLAPEWRVPLEPSYAAASAVLRTVESQSFFRDQAARSVTTVRDTALPWRPAPGERVLLVGKNSLFLSVGRRYAPGARELLLTETSFYSSSAADRARFAAATAGIDTVVFLMSDPGSVQVLEAGRASPARVIVMSILTPVYLARLPWVTDAVAIYGWGIESFEAGFAALAGDIPTHGRLPVDFSLFAE